MTTSFIRVSLLQKFYLFILLVGLLACQDHLVQGPQRLRLASYKQAFGLNTYQFTFTYDASNRLSGYTSRLSPSLPSSQADQLSRLIYDAQNRLIETDLNYNYGIGGPQIRHIFTYDASNNPTTDIESINYPNTTTFELYSTTTFQYENGNQRPVRLSTVFTNSTLPATTLTYTYSGGNIIKASSVSAGNPPSITAYTYDNTLSPFYALWPAFGEFFSASLSANNYVSDDNGAYQISYNSNGLISRRTRANDPSFYETFEYESY